MHKCLDIVLDTELNLTTDETSNVEQIAQNM